MKYDRTIIAYHGCDAVTADRILAGAAFRPSENDYDWLGSGIYFWEYGYDRALRFAQEQRQRRKIKHPAVLGAVLQLGKCFDLMDTKFTDELLVAFEMLEKHHRKTGQPLPENRGSVERKLRRLDCAVLNMYLGCLDRKDVAWDTVRCGFLEGPPAFPGSDIRHGSHVQVAVRNPACVVGVFQPR